MYCYISIDLHVLGTPPAFILSQDQTLHLISSSIVTAYRCLSCINLLTFVVSCNVSISCSVFKELPHCPFEQCSMSISSSRFLCQHVFRFFFSFHVRFSIIYRNRLSSCSVYAAMRLRFLSVLSAYAATHDIIDHDSILCENCSHSLRFLSFL